MSQPMYGRTFNISALSPETKKEIKIRLRKSYDQGHIIKYPRNHLSRPTIGSWSDPHRKVWLHNSQSRLAPSILTTICNKTTTLYQHNCTDLQGKEICTPTSTVLSGCIFDEWFVYHKGKPDIEFSQFFADLVPIAMDGPKSISEIIKAHISTCNEALSFLRDIRNGRIQAPKQLYDDVEFQCHPEKYTINPLQSAIFIVLDELHHPEYEYNHPKVERYLDLSKHSKEQNVLLIRTGHESELSAPIDFEELQEQSLPLRRSDIEVPISENPTSKNWAVRVPLAAAFKFISDLEHREYTAFPELRVGAGPGNFSYGSANFADVEMNNPNISLLVKKAVQGVMDGMPYKESLSYAPGSGTWAVRSGPEFLEPCVRGYEPVRP